MAIVWVDGFDGYRLAGTLDPGIKGVTFSGSGNTFVTGRNSQGRAWRSASSSAGTYSFNVTASSTFCVGFAFKPASLPGSTQTYLQFQHSGTQDVIIGVKSDGSVVAGTTDFSGGLLGTSAAGVIGTSYNYIEVEILRSATVGTITVYVNGVSVLALTGLNTGGTNYNQILLKGNTSSNTDFDDLYVNDTNARLSTSSIVLPTIYLLRPTADTATVDWTPLSGTDHFAMVNETVWDGDISYISSTSPTDNDVFDMADLPTSPVSIKALQYLAVSRGIGGASIVGPTLKSGATTVSALGSGGNTAYTMDRAILLTDPNTSAAWTESGVNASQGGVRCTTNVGTSTRCTCIGFEVLVLLSSAANLTGTIATTLTGISQVLHGNDTTAHIATALVGISQALSAFAKHTSTITTSLSGISQVLHANDVTSHIVSTLSGITQTISGIVTNRGSITTTLTGISQTLHADDLTARITTTLSGISQAVVATATHPASIVTTLFGAAQTLAGHIARGAGQGRRSFWTS